MLVLVTKLDKELIGLSHLIYPFHHLLIICRRKNVSSILGFPLKPEHSHQKGRREERRSKVDDINYQAIAKSITEKAYMLRGKEESPAFNGPGQIRRVDRAQKVVDPQKGKGILHENKRPESINDSESY